MEPGICGAGLDFDAPASLAIGRPDPWQYSDDSPCINSPARSSKSCKTRQGLLQGMIILRSPTSPEIFRRIGLTDCGRGTHLDHVEFGVRG